MAENGKVNGILGTEIVKGIHIEYGIDSCNDLYDFCHPSSGPPIGHYWSKEVLVDSIILSIENFNSFIIQYSETKLHLEALNTCMNEWYDEYWVYAPVMPKENILIGGFYVAYVEKYSSWYRCCVDDLILEQNGKYEIVVNLIDYGEFAIVPEDSILFLRDFYCVLPRQAAKAQFYGLEKQYTDENIEQFCKEVTGEIYQVCVVERDYDSTLLYPKLSVLLRYYDNGDYCFYKMSGCLQFRVPECIIEAAASENSFDDFDINYKPSIF